MDEESTPVKRGRGRPKGSKNRVPLAVMTPRVVPPGTVPHDDYRTADPLTLVSRQYAMVDRQQQALRQEMQRGIKGQAGTHANVEDGIKLVDIGNALMKTMNAHKQALVIAETLQKNKTPAELLEIAIKKIEGQDLPTIEAVIKRLRRYRQTVAPVTYNESLRMSDGSPQQSAMEGLHTLGDD